VEEMVDYLDGVGGAMDYGRFTKAFPGVKKRQLEDHFDFVSLDGTSTGPWEIRLLGQDPPPRGPEEAADGGASGSPARGDVQVGTIVRYDETNGYGFILLDERGEDVFFPRSSLPLELNSAVRRGQSIIGSRMELEVKVKPDGKLRAANLVLLGAGPVEEMPVEGEPMEGERYLGRIATFNRQKGYGFVASPDLRNDIFFMHNLLPKGLDRDSPDLIDTVVEYEIGMREDEDKPRVVWMGMPRQPPPGAGHGGGGGGPHDVARGVICSFDEVKGFGFIAPEGLPEDVFFAQAELPHPFCAPGGARRDQLMDRRVEFQVKQMPGGKFRGLRLFFLGSGQAPGPMLGPGMARPVLGPNQRVGRVRKFDKAKGYGFIVVPGESQDIFFLPSALPPEVPKSEKVVDMEFSFDLSFSDDGKPRASRLMPWHSGLMPPMMPPPMIAPGILAPPPIPPTGGARESRGEPREASGRGRRGHPRSVGNIQRYEKAKGYGFIAMPGSRENVFFMRSNLPRGLRERDDEEQLRGLEVSYELYTKEEGKPRARDLQVVRSGRDRSRGRKRRRTRSPSPPRRTSRAASTGERREGEAPGERREGEVCSFDATRGYGFIKDDAGGEDVFFSKGELPPGLQAVKEREDLLTLRVSFEVKTMPDGKMRALRIEVAEVGEGDNGREFEEGVFDDRAPDEDDFVPPEEDVPPEDAAACDDEASHRGEEENENEEGADEVRSQGAREEAEEQEVRLGPGMLPRGHIRSFDSAKGIGFIVCEHFSKDIFFPRSALPPNFQSKRRTAGGLPDIVGAEVSFELTPVSDRGPRAERVNLVLRYQADTKRWFLQRH